VVFKVFKCWFVVGGGLGIVYLFVCVFLGGVVFLMVVLGCLGEHEIISILRERLLLMPDMPVLFGDDVSGVSVGCGCGCDCGGEGGGEVVVLKTDMLVGRTDVPLGMGLCDAARKAVVMCVSDFASKGVLPVAVLVALGLPRRLATRGAVVEIVDGLNAAVREYGAYVVGGDVGETDDLTITVSLYGRAKKGDLMLRSGAKPGDILAVTGLFGKSTAGLHLILNKNNLNLSSLSSGVGLVLERAVFCPCARLVEGVALSRSGCVSASMDSSDGLAWSLYELMRMSGVGFVVDALPVAPEAVEFAKQTGLDAEELALYGGEEYELVLTVDPKNWQTAKTAVQAVGGTLIPIGKATAKKQLVLTNTTNNKKRQKQIKPKGYEHFKTQI
jgi:thiamine-monophosphate kinase